MIRDELLKILQSRLISLKSSDDAIGLQHPTDLVHGDFSTNIALKLATIKKKSPLVLAKDIKGHLEKDELIDKIEIAPPGFINFFIKRTRLLEELGTIIEKKESYGNSTSLLKERIIIEYTDPNPFKEFHIGHLYSNIIGESLARILEANGSQVMRVNYFGDIGMHVAKSIWGLQKKLEEEKINLVNLEIKSNQEKARFLGEGYALGTIAFENDQKAKDEIIRLNKKIYSHKGEIYKLYLKGREWSLNYFEEIYKRLKNNKGKGSFDKYYPESEVGEDGLKYVKTYLERGIFEESKGAIIFPGEKYGLHSRVFINSQGLPTYEAKELGLAPKKYKDFPYDLSIIVAGMEIYEYFKVLIEVLMQVNPELGKKTKHLAHGMVRLPQGKMSSRSGNVITGEWLLNELNKKAIDKINEVTKTANLSDNEKKDIAEHVGISAVKYSLLKNSIGENIEFNIEKSVNFEGDSGPYLLYSYVRCQSILTKAGSTDQLINSDYKDLTVEDENLLRAIYKFPEVVEEAAIKFAPHLIAHYLYKLAKDFNMFYQKNPILKASVDIKPLRVTLTKAVSTILKRGLYLLGIETVEKM